jgi:hypothetical protein
MGLLPSSCPSVRPIVREKQLGSHSKDFHEMLYLSIFRKCVKNVQVALKSDKSITVTLHGDQCTILIISHSVFLRKINVFRKKSFRQHQNTYYVQYLIFFLENHTVYEIMWKIFRVGQTTDNVTRSEYVILTDFPLQRWLRGGPWTARAHNRPISHHNTDYVYTDEHNRKSHL